MYVYIPPEMCTIVHLEAEVVPFEDNLSDHSYYLLTFK